MRKLTPSLILFLFLLPFTFAGSVFWGSDQKYGNETFSRATLADELNWSLGAGCSLSSSMLSCTGLSTTGAYINQMPDVSINSANWSTEWKGKVSGCSGNGYYYLGFSVGNNTGNSMSIHIQDGSTTNLEIRDNTNGQTSSTFPNWKADGTLQNIRVVVGNQELAVYVNSSNGWLWQASKIWSGGQVLFVRMFQLENCQGYYDNFTAYNTSVYPSGPIIDNTPPEITYYNITNDAGCENWNTDKNNACSVSSATPTIQFNTSEPAWCAISRNASYTLGMNYTGMGNSRNCTGAMAGEGGMQNHRCTLTPQDTLVYETSYIHISCKDASNNTNRTSTSGPLKIYVTSLESDAKSFIGLGAQNALLSGYTNYTNQQIYARSSSNSQVKGTFDFAVQKGTKTWAFNRIGATDVNVNMFNLTPVLYTLELANKTSAQITNQVELLINATK